MQRNICIPRSVPRGFTTNRNSNSAEAICKMFVILWLAEQLTAFTNLIVFKSYIDHSCTDINIEYFEYRLYANFHTEISRERFRQTSVLKNVKGKHTYLGL